MRSNSSRRTILAGLLFAGTLGTAPGAFAQEGPPPFPGPPPFGRPGGMGPGGIGRGGPMRIQGPVSLAQVPVPTLRDLLGLTDAQMKQMDEIIEKAREERFRMGPPGRPPGARPTPGETVAPGNTPDAPQRPAPGAGGTPGDLPPGAPPFPGGRPMRGGMGGPGQMWQGIEAKVSGQMDALLTDAQRKRVPETLKAMQTLRDAGVHLAVVAKLKLTDAQRTTLSEAAGKTWDAAKMRTVLDAHQMEFVEPFFGASPMGGMPPGAGFAPPGGGFAPPGRPYNEDRRP